MNSSNRFAEVGRVALLGIAAWALAEGAIGQQASAQPSFPLYCAGPLNTGGNTTPFTWANQGAGAAAPAAGHCAWADRGPEGTEIQAGGNVIIGIIDITVRSGDTCKKERVTKIEEGKWLEIGVFRDVSQSNHLVLTQVVGFVTPVSGKFDSDVKLPPPVLCADAPPNPPK
jgi:hypothetical protein